MATHKSPKAGASLAYYSIFSLDPLIVVVSIVGLAAEHPDRRDRRATDRRPPVWR
jgi:uncharacterized BrkB/YihY/UPF0761 family membrane protein